MAIGSFLGKSTFTLRKVSSEAIGSRTTCTSEASPLTCAASFFVFFVLRAFVAFTIANKPLKAMEAHRESLRWQDVFAIALAERLPAHEIVALARDVAGTFSAPHWALKLQRRCKSF